MAQYPQDIISDLLMKSFGSRQIGEQKAIIQQQRPMPTLTLKTKDRVFQEDRYNKKEWLCGSASLNRLFCWPCLLFCPGKSQSWTEKGYANMHSFLSDCKKREKATCHFNTFKQWKTFDVSERVDVVFSRARREEIGVTMRRSGKKRDVDNSF